MEKQLRCLLTAAARGTKETMRYLLRFSEVGTKAPGTRRRFLRQLEENLRDAFKREGIPATITMTMARGEVESEDAQAGKVLARIFGLRSFSKVVSFSLSSLDDIVAKGLMHFRDRVEGKRFAVRARRVGRHPFSSHDIEVQLGAVLDPFAQVDLTDPEITASVEVRDKQVFFFSERTDGPGGLPLGTQGRALVLLSGGFDSAVAAWNLMRRGVSCDYVFFNLGGPLHEEGVLRVAKHLADHWQYGDEPSIVIVPFTDVVAHIRERTDEHYWNLVLKHAMLETASRVASSFRARPERSRRTTAIDAIATGDAIGQVSSQTLKNLAALGDVPSIVLRPLLAFDKDDIIKRARAIGTEELSAVVKEYCAIVPQYPVTASTPEAFSHEWEKVDLEVLDAAAKAQRVLSLKTLTFPEKSILEEVATDDILEGACIIDVRQQHDFNAWHAPLAEHVDAYVMLGKLEALEPGKPVLFYCEHGLLSAELAHAAREKGIDAWSFKGGADALRTKLKTQSSNPK